MLFIKFTEKLIDSRNVFVMKQNFFKRIVIPLIYTNAIQVEAGYINCSEFIYQIFFCYLFKQSASIISIASFV